MASSDGTNSKIDIPVSSPPDASVPGGCTDRSGLLALLRRSPLLIDVLDNIDTPSEVFKSSTTNERRTIARVLVSLAEQLEEDSNRRQTAQKPNLNVLACCVFALALDPESDNARLRLLNELYHRKSYQQGIRLAALIRTDSPVCAKADEIQTLCQSKLSEWISKNVNPKDKDDVIERGIKSPVKLLKQIGPQTAQQLSPQGDESVTIAEAVIPVQNAGKALYRRVEECQTVLWPGEDEIIPSRSRELADSLKAMLVPLSGCFKIISWNAMASLPNHGITKSMLSIKTRNLVSVAQRYKSPKVSLYCVQECPGEYIANAGSIAAQATLTGESTFLAQMLTNLKDIGTYEGAEVSTPGQSDDGSPCGESHIFAWDTDVWKSVSEFGLPKALSYEGLRRAVSLLVLQPHDAPGFLLAVISVHLKSGGGDETRADLRIVEDRAVPSARKTLAEIRRRDPTLSNVGCDSVLVVGDFNMPPSDQSFEALREDGFEYIGCPNGNATNQSEFTVSGDMHIYDGAWLWKSKERGTKQSKNSRLVSRGEVMEVQDIQQATEDRDSMLTLLAEVLTKWQPQSEIGQKIKATYVAEKGRQVDSKTVPGGAVGRTVLDSFKRQVNADYSDHKPICLDVRLWQEKVDSE